MDIVKSASENQEKEEEITSHDESDCPSDTFEENSNSKWCYMPDSILLNIFQYLTLRELIIAGEVCKSWHRVSYDGFLWKNLFYQTYEIDPVVGMMPGKTSWFEEFKRLTYHIPLIQTEELTKHNHEVLHVSFSHNGEMFATCSKDGCIFVWKSQYPVKIKYEYNMKSFRWKSTRFSQFNSSDTLLLVSGAHPGSESVFIGEIAVFSLTPDFELQCRVMNTPFDVNGAWYTEHYLLSGSLHWLHHTASVSVFWLNKANQELSSENIPIITQLFRFPNGSGPHVRAIMVANCLTSEVPEDVHEKDVEDEEVSLDSSFELQSALLEDCLQYVKPLQYNQEYNSQTRESLCIENSQQHKENIQSTDIEENVAEIVNCCEKYLIFTTGSDILVPHEVAFKRIKNVKFPTSIYPGRSYTLKERRRDRIVKRQLAKENPDAVVDIDVLLSQYDTVDHVIDLHGRIVGMGLSPDHRYLYVNIRPWPEGIVIEYLLRDDLPPPLIAREMEIRVIDLVTLKEVGRMARAHTAYVNDNTILYSNGNFPDVCDEYVASGAEHKHGYLWDRYYGLSLVKFHHSDTVNSVAFNPRDPEMLVTTSNDRTIKIWRSRSKVYELGLNKDSYPRGAEIQNRNKHRKASNSDLPNIYDRS
ncbi:F-box and WD repeat domain containing 5 [Lasioglossum baleicum]|uniref:F-box and WD repeat domain containing 5 n=1 Tax=Lasioglossum baleicum TaxID=434251 RepID=UPI003FCE32A5